MIFLAVLTIAFLGMSVYTATVRDTTSLENTFLQFLGILAGAGFSWVIGDGGGQAKAEKEMRVRARPAFRRVVRLYQASGRLVSQIDEQRAALHSNASSGKIDIRLVDAALTTLSVQVSEQIGTADDAMEDWRDLAPDEVAELEARATRRDEDEESGTGVS